MSKYLEEVMKDWPSGSYLNMITNVDGVDLIATGYKYCNRKSLNFIWTKGAGNTEPGKPYEANWIDSNGNRCVRFVNRPAVISFYFERSNKIDISNQMRQSELKLEKVWKTNCGYFHLLPTLIGCNVVDCWRSYRRHCTDQHRHKEIDLLEFTSMLAFDMLHNDLTDEEDVCLNINIMNHITTPAPMLSPTPRMNQPTLPTNIERTRPNNAANSWHRSMLDKLADFCMRHELEQEEARMRHILVCTRQREKDSSTSTGDRHRRALCIYPGCKKKTSRFCRACESGNRDYFWVCKHHKEWHIQKYRNQLK